MADGISAYPHRHTRIGMDATEVLAKIDAAFQFADGTLMNHDVLGILSMEPHDKTSIVDMLLRIHDEICTGGTWDDESVTYKGDRSMLWSNIGWCIRSYWCLTATR